MNQDLTKGPFTKSMLLFAVPMILGDLLQQRYNIADSLKSPLTEVLHLIGKQTESPGALPVRNKRNSRKLSCDGLRLFIL